MRKPIIIKHGQGGLSEGLPPLAAYWAQVLRHRGGLRLEAYFENHPDPVGLCMLCPNSGAADVVYLFVEEDAQRQGVARALLESAGTWAGQRGMGLTLRVVAEHENSAALTALALHCGFRAGSRLRLFASDGGAETTATAWTAFRAAKGNRLCLFLERRGYETVSFRLAPPPMLDQLRAEIGSAFPGWLNPFYLINRDDDYSFVTYRDSIPQAFCAATAIGSKLVFEQLAVRKGRLGSGVFLPPLCAFIDRMIAEQVPRVTYAVYDDNQAMGQLSDGFLRSICSPAKHQITYERWPRGPEGSDFQ